VSRYTEITEQKAKPKEYNLNKNISMKSQLNPVRPVILHFHIFKNAGISIEWTLEKNFLKKYSMEAYGTPFTQIMSMEAVIKFLKENTEISVFSSQNIRFPIPSDPSFNFIPIVFIRHPIDRAFSVYNFIRRNPETQPASKEARSMDLSEFIQWNLDKRSRMLDDCQLTVLSDNNLKNDDERFLSALKRIKQCPILGVVDRFDESMVLAEEHLKTYFVGLDLAYLKQNVTLNREDNIQQRLESGRAQIGDKLMHLLIERNNYDLKLYNAANEEINLRIKQVDGFLTKLTDFQERCNILKQEKNINFPLGKRLVYAPKRKILLEKQ